MRRRARRNVNSTKYIIMTIFVMFLVCISAGYAIFNQEMNLTGKSNINYAIDTDDIEITIMLSNSWTSEDGNHYQYSIELINNRKTTLEGWGIVINVPEDTVVTNPANNAETELLEDKIIFTNKDYNKNVESGGTISFEFQIITSEKNLIIDSAILNGSTTGGTGTQIQPTNITINPIDMIIHVGEISKISATRTPQNAVGTIIWTTSNSEVATVDSKGNVTGVLEGTAIITATINGISTTCNVEVISRVIQNVLEIELNESGEWQDSGKYVKQYAVTLNNISESNVSNWQFDIEIPEGATMISYNANTSQNENIVTISSLSYNGSIAIDGKVDIVIQVSSPIQEYTLNAINIITK